MSNMPREVQNAALTGCLCGILLTLAILGLIWLRYGGA